ncbi:MAG: DUF2490 domain-containing protein [Bryobacteraceae bacterium]|nr:DUF2490 domain-containing protein [Bryobacteraceae bacterium]
MLWTSFNMDKPVWGRWGVHFDTQWRRDNVGFHWQQYQLRPGINYRISDNVLLTIGYVFTRTYPYGDYPVARAIPEHRPYEQLLVRHRVRGMRVSHRFRLEQRFIRYPTEADAGITYQNRFRYLARAEFPVGKSGEWYVPVFNETLIGFRPNYGARPWDQNRLFVGIGRLTERFAVDIGYMKQLLGQRNGRIYEVNHTIMVSTTLR